MQMASIEKRQGKEGCSYRVAIRKKGIEIYKTFSNEEDANLYVFFKERLIDNMENFDVPLNQRITLEQIIELKKDDQKNLNPRADSDLDLAFSKINKFLPEK